MPGQTFEVPNTVVVYWAGEAGVAGKRFVHLSEDVQYLRDLGFNVVVAQHGKEDPSRRETHPSKPKVWSGESLLNNLDNYAPTGNCSASIFGGTESSATTRITESTAW